MCVLMLCGEKRSGRGRVRAGKQPAVNIIIIIISLDLPHTMGLSVSIRKLMWQ